MAVATPMPSNANIVITVTIPTVNARCCALNSPSPPVEDASPATDTGTTTGLGTSPTADPLEPSEIASSEVAGSTGGVAASICAVVPAEAPSAPLRAMPGGAPSPVVAARRTCTGACGGS